MIYSCPKCRDTFTELYTLYVEKIHCYIYRRVGNVMLAEDLTSDVFLQAWAKIRHYEDRGKPFVSWLYAIARSRVADYYRRLMRNPEIIHLDDVYVAVLPKLDTRLVEQELAAYMHKIIIALTEDQRQVVILRFREDRSIKEVAKILDRKPNAVKQLQHRAIYSMRKYVCANDVTYQDCCLTE